jgi:hypothetical protein
MRLRKKGLFLPLLAALALVGCNATTVTSGSVSSSTAVTSTASVTSDSTAVTSASEYNDSTSNSAAGKDDGTSTSDEITPSDTTSYTASEGYTYTAIEDYSTVLTTTQATAMADEALPDTITTITDASSIITTAGNYLYNQADYTDITITLTTAGAVHIYLNNATITASKKAIQVSGGETPTLVTITAVEGSVNTITASESKAKNAVDITGDLAVNGKGTLAVTSYNSCLKASKTMLIQDVTLNLNALGDLSGHGISAETVLGKDAIIHVEDAGKDGIHAEIDDLLNTDGSFVLGTSNYINSAGYVWLTDVTFTYAGTGDGIQADSFLYVNGGTYTIQNTGTWVAYDATLISSGDYVADDFKFVQNGATYKKVDSEQRGRSGTYALQESVKGFRVGEIDQENEDTGTSEDIFSEKYYLAVENATLNFNTTDDGVHVNDGYLNMANSTFTSATLDQPLSSDGPMTLTNLALNVTSCYEGLQGSTVVIKGSNTQMTIVASDDGMNATSDYLATDKTFYQETLIINDGTIHVTAGGDGLDSNGSLVFNGGTVIVEGSSDNGNSPLDSAAENENSDDNGIYINGGTLMATGTTGMFETPQTTSTAYSISYGATSNFAAGTVIALKDANGTTLVSNTTTKTGNAAIFASPYITKGGTYTVYVGGTAVGNATVSSMNTVIGTITSGNSGGPGGGGQNPGGGGHP